MHVRRSQGGQGETLDEGAGVVSAGGEFGPLGVCADSADIRSGGLFRGEKTLDEVDAAEVGRVRPEE